jgi:threonine aldolase
MRQAGILAAAGLYALEHHRPHLADDHEKARVFAEGMEACAAFSVDLDTVETNIVLFDVNDGAAQPVVDRIADEGVLLTPFGPKTIRATFHRDVSMDAVSEAVETIQALYAPTAA